MSITPLVGGPALVAFDAVFPAPVARRQEAFLVEVDRLVRELIVRIEGLTLEDLTSNELLVSLVAQAAPVWMRTHQEEKRQALLNALQNSVLLRPDGDVAQMFLSMLNYLTPSHMAVLKWLSEEPDIDSRHHRARDGLNEAFPQLAAQQALDQIVEDLVSRGLVDAALRPGPYLITSDPPSSDTFATNLGLAFLKFVEQPAWP